MAARKKAKIGLIPARIASKKTTVSEKLAILQTTIRAYFEKVKYRQPEYTLRFEAILTGENGTKREHMVNVPSLIASIATAQGLGKEIKLRADTNRNGGTLYIEFYSPVRVEANGPDLLS